MNDSPSTTAPEYDFTSTPASVGNVLTPEEAEHAAAAITKKKLQEVMRYRKALTRMALLDQRRGNRIKKSRSLRDRQRVSRKANRRAK